MKKYKKRTLSLFLILCYVVGSVVAPSAVSEKNTVQQGATSVTDFTDVKENDWYYPYLETLVSEKIINGKSKTIFDPNGSFSFAECSAVITRYLGLDYEAKLRKEKIDSSIGKTSEWFSGYMQIMYELNIFDESSNLFTLQNSFVVADKEKCAKPMKRHELATAVSKSFELNGDLKTKNLYHEISGLGHDYIVGGRYNKEYLNKYSKMINDFESIPEQSKQFVLKAYYNGILNGDLLGNFNPNELIKRCEIAKILAAIRDFDMRKFLIDDYCPVAGEDKLFTDGKGNKTLKYTYSNEILQGCVSRFDIDGTKVSYLPPTALPLGYAVDIYIYEVGENEFCTQVKKYTISDDNIYSDKFTYEMNSGKVLRAILVLRNINKGGTVEFSLNTTISDEGILSKSLIYNI